MEKHAKEFLQVSEGDKREKFCLLIVLVPVFIVIFSVFYYLALVPLKCLAFVCTEESVMQKCSSVFARPKSALLGVQFPLQEFNFLLHSEHQLSFLLFLEYFEWQCEAKWSSLFEQDHLNIRL